MNENANNNKGLGIFGLTLLWGIITQCLQWAGLIDWPWIAIWLPFLISLGLIFVLIVIIAIAKIMSTD